MPEGTFGDNISGFLQGLTGEILKRKDEERALKQRDEDLQLRTGLNLFQEMMSNPDKYDDTSIRLFADMLGKNHKLESVIGQKVQDAINPLLANRAKLYEQFSQNKNLKSLVGENLGGYTPADLRRLAPMAAQMDFEARHRAADLEYKTQQELARSQAETARQQNELAIRSLMQEKADMADIERQKIMAQSQQNVAKMRENADLQQAGMQADYKRLVLENSKKKTAHDKAIMEYRALLGKQMFGEKPPDFEKIYNKHLALAMGYEYTPEKEEEDPLIGRADGILGTLAGPTTTTTSTPTTTTFPRRKAGYSGTTYSYK